MTKLRDSVIAENSNMEIIDALADVENCKECPFMLYKNGTVECISFTPTVVSCQLLRHHYGSISQR